MTVLVVAEHRNGTLRDVTFEMITAGRDLADQLDSDLTVAVISGDVDRLAEQVNCEGVDAVTTVDFGDTFNHGVYTQVVEQLYEELDPKVVVLPNSVNGLDYAPAVANRLNLSLATDTIELTAADDSLRVVREMYGSKVETTVDIDRPAVVTVRPTEWPPASGEGSADISSFTADIDESALGSKSTGFEEVVAGGVDISDAEFIVAVGRGIEDEENLPLIEELVDVTGATLAASRPIVDNEWLPKNRQIGQSGKVVTPDVYIAVGISGAVQHVAGMKGSDTIVAINSDPNAPIFDIADYGIVADLFEVVPELIEAFDGESPL
ncbi:electron transfer flavoprotein subunit alpha/FixB family protein [Haloferax sp. ATB1]|uniref:electron transfer flavoprotein subunit alpha/FixB family protein n=1 Tax=Haloferax sp. ATB1 TaxID=1508454 RepID=UPI0005B1D90D|nr:electron transfer flavoprotein subunit alpha/FixB family protein [Haloferax sp. ATB1]